MKIISASQTLESIQVLKPLPHGHVGVEGEGEVLDGGVVVEEGEQAGETSDCVLAVCEYLWWCS